MLLWPGEEERLIFMITYNDRMWYTASFSLLTFSLRSGHETFMLGVNVK